MNRKMIALTLCATGALWSVAVPAGAQSTMTPDAQPTPSMPEGNMPAEPASPAPAPMPAEPMQDQTMPAPAPMPGEPMPAQPMPAPQMAEPTASSAPQAQASYPPCSRTLQDQCTNTRRGSDTKARASMPRKQRPR